MCVCARAPVGVDVGAPSSAGYRKRNDRSTLTIIAGHIQVRGVIFEEIECSRLKKLIL